MRHGIAEHPIGKIDRDRALTSEGIDIVTQVGTALARKDIRPEVILSSPYLRAIQTSDIIASELGYEFPVERDSRLTPNSNFNLLHEILIEYAAAQSLMIVSHEPAVSEFASMLCPENQTLYGFAPASICCVLVESIPTIRGTLYWFSSAEEIIEG
jgi:phosphohistidine phosphatase